MNLLLALLPLLLQDEPQGTPEQRLQYRLARSFDPIERLDAALLGSAKNASSFGLRYVSAMVQLKDTLTRGDRHEACYQRISSLSAEGGPAGTGDHLRALAAGFKAAVYCRDCTNGKVVCAQCQGKKRTEVKCFACEGKGRVGAPGAVDKTAVTMKCRNCDGKAVFRDARCPSCSGTGVNECPACLGSPWHDRACFVKECRTGRVPCPQCHGNGKGEGMCATCQGKGRVGAPGAIDPTQVTQRCNDCDGKGFHKDKPPCPNCEGSPVGIGYLKCSACKEGRKASFAAPSAVFETEACASCGGKGWPAEGKAVACPKCQGLGVRLKPVASPFKTLD